MFRGALIALLLTTVSAQAELQWVECGDYEPSIQHHFVHHEWLHAHHVFHRPHSGKQHIIKKPYCRHIYVHRLCLRDISLSGGGSAFGTYPEADETVSDMGVGPSLGGFGFGGSGSDYWGLERYRKEKEKHEVDHEHEWHEHEWHDHDWWHEHERDHGHGGGGGNTPPVPEPSTWVMLVIGFFALGWWVGLRKRCSSARR